jgi:hypothetical protein
VGLQIARDWVRRFDAAGSAHDESIFHPFRVTNSAHPRRHKGMQTEISSYDATGYRDALKHVALLLANIMHLVDLKRGGYSPSRTEMRIDRLTDRPRSISSLSKMQLPSLDVPTMGPAK